MKNRHIVIFGIAAGVALYGVNYFFGEQPDEVVQEIREENNRQEMEYKDMIDKYHNEEPSFFKESSENGGILI
jgi:hypothetical protein